ncbi:predicted protein [Histoplasma mississippiense (nom. inval.)]|uniref:predicted protein n=1 Tax=Ajellomyces capsulatus (strain NAm1 / WU24) TaxID=2059318 RepID=UPI000157B691|nr:predicted protein [Histoplasma mississippiense (nom. inval.)]EDN02467.1 predicted protein [Histoplasma mississippiense (nom. inval.)]
MPEVISLLSSPFSETHPVRPSPVTSEPLTRTAGIPSDDSIFDWGDTNPSKKRKLSSQRGLSPPRQPTLPPEKRPLLLFSDLEESIISSPGTQLDNDCNSTKSRKWNGDISDPIEFTSSAADGTSTHDGGNHAKRTPAIITLDDSIIETDDLPSPGCPLNIPSPTILKTGLSDKTTNLLLRIQNRSSAEPIQSKQRVSTHVSKSIPSNSRMRMPDPNPTTGIDSSSPPPVLPTSKSERAPKMSTTCREMREAERRAAMERREKEREEVKARKQKLKEQKAKEKQLAADLAEANKRKFDKKISTPEMIIDMSTSFEESSVGNQVTEYMRHLGVEKHFVSTRIPNIVTWRRKVTAHLDSHVLKIKRTYSGCKPIYLIEGLGMWMKKNNNSRNRAYQASVLRELECIPQLQQPQQPPKRQRKPKQAALQPALVDDDTIEDALLQLQVQHGCLIQHTAAPSESAEWIKNFTEHISTIPYGQELINLHDASFCMDAGQVKSGEDNADTYVKMLQEIQRVTAPISYGIASQYPTVGDLATKLKEQGPLLLEDVKKCANRSGALTDARVGPAMSKRLYKVFTGLNPSSTDI